MIYCILLYMVSMQWCPREGKNKEDENRWCFPKWRRGTKFISVFWWWWCWWCWQLLPIMMKTINLPKIRDRGKFPPVSWRWRCWCWWWRQRKGKCCCRLSASAHQSLCSFYLSKVTDGFQTDLSFMCSSSISPSLFSCRLSVPPLSHPEMIINHCKIGNFRKILAPVKISIPLLIRSVTCAKNGIFPGKKNVERRGVSVACRGGWGYQICSLALGAITLAPREHRIPTHKYLSLFS